MEITLSNEMSFTLICLYRPPSANADFLTQFKRMLNHCDKNKEIILIGDFNINWDDKKGRKNLKVIMDKHNLEQQIEQPTRITKSSQTRIDLLFTNKPERIAKTFNFLNGISDHNIILFSRKLTKQRLKMHRAPTSSITNVVPRSQAPHLKEALTRIDWEETLSSINIDTNSNSFINKLKEVMSSFACKGGHRAKKGKNLPWLDQNCRNLLKNRDVLLKQYLKTGLTTDRLKFTHARNKAVQRMRKAKANFIVSIIESAKGNGKKTWQILNKLLGKNKQETKALELEVNNDLVKDSSMVANIFN